MHESVFPSSKVRRAAAAVLGTWLGLWAGLAALEAKESDDARVRARIREYTESATGELRRDLIVRELSGADAAVAARLVREAMLSEVRRGPSMDLAARLRLPGVFESAKRWADSSPVEVLALALAAPEKSAAAWLAERWATSDRASERFRAVDDALRTQRAPPAVVDGVARSLSDPVRGEAALAVLRAQMGVDDACPSALIDRWAAARERFGFEAREFPRDGDDLLACPGWRLRAARPVGRNLRLPPATCVDLPVLPLPFQTGGGTLRLHVAAGDGRGAQVSVATEGNTQDLRLRCDGTSWFLVEGPPRDGERVEAPFRVGDWAEIEVGVADPQIRGSPGVRDVRVRVDGRELRPSGGFWRVSSPPTSLSIVAAEGEAPTLIGGLSWRRP